MASDDFDENVEMVEKIFRKVSIAVGHEGNRLDIKDFEKFAEGIQTLKHHIDRGFFSILETISDQLLEKVPCTNPIIKAIFLKSNQIILSYDLKNIYQQMSFQ